MNETSVIPDKDSAELAALNPRVALKLRSQLCFALYSTMLAVNKVYRKPLRDLGLTYPQYLVMLVLWERDGLIVSEICEQLFLETTTLTPLLKRLEARGLLNRQRSTSDERQVVVTLTPEGKALYYKAAPTPACVAKATECSLEDLANLRETLVELRTRLLKNA